MMGGLNFMNKVLIRLQRKPQDFLSENLEKPV